MKILVTGAAGQIGHDLLGYLIARADEVIATDLNPPQAPASAGLQWRRLDVTDAQAVTTLFAELRPQIVYHLAGVLSARGEGDPQAAYRVNQTGTYNVLEACRLTRVERLIFTSSIAVYGPGLPQPVSDDAPLRPTTIYGVTKVACELLGEYYFSRYGLDFRAVRFPGLISAVKPGAGTSDYALYMYTEGILKGAYEAYCRPDTRIPLMYMPDAVRGLVELAQADRARLSRCVYNIAAMSPTALEVADSVTSAAPLPGAGVGVGVRITFKPDPARQAILDSWPEALDDHYARVEWGWRPRFDLHQMTEDLVPRVRALAGSRVFHEPD